MKTLFTINGVIEILAGLGMIFGAAMIPGMETADELHLYFANMYGAAAFSVGILSFLVIKSMDNAGLIHAFLTMGTVFHVGVALMNFKSMGMTVDTLPIAILHTIMAVGFLYFLFKK